jgi:hypothetical protein
MDGQDRIDAMLRWLEAHRADLAALPYGRLQIDWGTGKVEFHLTTRDTVRLTSDGPAAPPMCDS